MQPCLPFRFITAKFKMTTHFAFLQHRTSHIFVDNKETFWGMLYTAFKQL